MMVVSAKRCIFDAEMKKKAGIIHFTNKITDQ